MKIRQVLGIFLSVVGVSLIIWAVSARYTAGNKEQQLINDFKKSIEQLGQGETGDIPATGEATPDDPALKDSVNDRAIAILTIPKIDLVVPVMEGTSNDSLKYSVGHFDNTAMPGEKGNFCVAGHRSYTYNEYFNRLDEVKNGDVIEVQTRNGATYKYQVNDIKVVEPSEVSVLDPTQDATITLVTCTPVRIATHRLIIKGKLVQ
ncbi:MAG: class D sortase [Bacillota bacterium]|nr:class D sortase [Bacillota bacterium]